MLEIKQTTEKMAQCSVRWSRSVVCLDAHVQMQLAFCMLERFSALHQDWNQYIIQCFICFKA